MIKQLHKLSIYFILLKTTFFVYLNPTKTMFSAFSFTFFTISVSYFWSLTQTFCFFHCYCYCNYCTLSCYWHFNIDLLYSKSHHSFSRSLDCSTFSKFLPSYQFFKPYLKKKKTKTTETWFSFMWFCFLYLLVFILL